MQRALHARGDLLGQRAKGGSGAAGIAGGSLCGSSASLIFAPLCEIKLTEPAFVEYFSGKLKPFERFEIDRNRESLIKMSGGKLIVEQEKIRSKRVKDIQSYLVQQERLAAWSEHVGRWSAAEVAAHRDYVHSKIVPFAEAYEWKAVLDFDHDFRTAQFFGDVTWADDASIMVQKQLMGRSIALTTAIAEAKAATAAMQASSAKPPPSKRARLELKHTHTTDGKEICIVYQLKKCVGACDRAHVCHVCRAKPCTCGQAGATATAASVSS